jgi:hypothetical protein
MRRGWRRFSHSFPEMCERASRIIGGTVIFA